MKLLKITALNIVAVAVILASCTTSQNNSLAAGSPETPVTFSSLEKYLTYQAFGASIIGELDSMSASKDLRNNQHVAIKQLRNNIRKISSKKTFFLSLNNADSYSLKIMELIYQLDLPIKVQWTEQAQNFLFSDLMTEPLTGFCQSLHQDAIDAIASNVIASDQKTTIIFMKNYSIAVKKLQEFLPNSTAIQFDSSGPQEFASMLLGINESQKRFMKIKNLNPNQELKFSPRARDDIQKIVLILEPSQYKSLLPALRYHGGSNFEYINFISSLESLEDVYQLLDFENTMLPLSLNIIAKIKSQEIESLASLTRDSVLNDWLLIELMNQSGIRSADISGMTGSLEFRKGSCAKRTISLESINSQLVTS